MNIPAREKFPPAGRMIEKLAKGLGT